MSCLLVMILGIGFCFRVCLFSLAICLLLFPVGVYAYQVEVVVPDMECENCVKIINDALVGKEVVESADFDLNTSKITLEVYEGAELEDEDIVRLLGRRGYRVSEISR